MNKSSFIIMKLSSHSYMSYAHLAGTHLHKWIKNSDNATKFHNKNEAISVLHIVESKSMCTIIEIYS